MAVTIPFTGRPQVTTKEMSVNIKDDKFLPVGVRVTPSGKYEATVQHSLLTKKATSNFDSPAQAEGWRMAALALLNAGYVPTDLAAKAAPGSFVLPPLNRVVDAGQSNKLARNPLADICAEYLRKNAVAPSSRATVEWLERNITIDITELTRKWAQQWVADMKGVNKLAPGSIRAKVGALARVVDWYLAEVFSESEKDKPANPLRTLGDGYSQYSPEDEAKAGTKRKDVARTRRLHEGEQERIEAATLELGAAGKIDAPDEYLMLTRLLLDTGARLREAYLCKVESITFKPYPTLHLAEGTTKTGKPRDVPLVPRLRDQLKAYIAAKGLRPGGMLFPTICREREEGETDWHYEAYLKKVTIEVSRDALTKAIKRAGCRGLKPHDYRHEATCRFMQLRTRRGGWMYQAEKVRKFTGHETDRMFMRYMSLQASDLAAPMYEDEEEGLALAV